MNQVTYSKLIFSISLLLFPLVLKAQFYTTGNTPWFTKYHTIETKNYQLIFPAEIDSTAIEFASLLDTVAPFATKPYKVKQSKITVVMNNQSVVSNGFVVWAPKRMEIVTSAPQEDLTMPWLDELALHEYRHVAQLFSLNRGFTNIAGYFLGQIAVGGVSGISPLWFYEGDAVFNETVLSNTGRGRSGDFLKDYSSLERAGIRYSYDKAYMGSYKNYVPSYYHMGYQMIKHVNQYYGEDSWDKVMLNVAKRPFTVGSFNGGLKKTIDLNKVRLYEQAMDSLRQEVLCKEDVSPVQPGMFTSYKALAIQSSDTLYALRTSMEAIPEIIRIVGSDEKRIHQPGYVTSTGLALSKSYLAWTEVKYDPRWDKRSFNVVRLKDLNSGRVTTLEKKSRHYSPSFSKDGDKLVLVNQALDHRFSLCIYDIESRKQLLELFPPMPVQLKYPVFVDDSTLLVLGVERNGTSFWQVNSTTQQWEQLTQPVFYTLENPVVQNGVVYYQSDYDGTMNIYSMDLKTLDLHRLTNDINGAYYPAIDNEFNVIHYASYTINGFKLNSLKVPETEQGSQRDSITYATYPFIEKHAEAKEFNLSEIELTRKDYTIEPYHKLLHSFSTHSWLPFYADADDILEGSISEIPVYPGALLFLQNNLETVYGQLGYYYKEGYHHLQPKLTFAGLYPVITVSYDVMGSDYRDLYKQMSYSPFSHVGNYNLTVKASVPLGFQFNAWNLYAQPSAMYYRESYSFDPDYHLDSLPNTNKYAIATLNMFLYQKKSERDINPRWGYQIIAQYTKPVNVGDQVNPYYIVEYSDKWYFYSRFLVPSLFKHHSLQAKISLANFYHSSLFPRGGNQIKYRDVRNNIAFKLDYLFPFAYPEWSIGPLAYIKRFSLDVFYDHAVFKYKDSPYNFDSYLNSTGISLRTDVNFLRFYAPFAITNQFSYNIKQGFFYVGFGMSYSL